MIVFTSDHGDYLGDHWMGEKDLFHDQSARIPLIIIDSSPAADERGVRSAKPWSRPSIWHRHLWPISVGIRRTISSKAAHCRRCCTARRRPTAQGRVLGIRLFDAGCAAEAQPADEQCRLFMVFDGRWKYIHASGFRPMLYDLQTIRRNLSTAAKIWLRRHYRALQAALFDWALHPKITSRPATRRSPPMPITSSRSGPAS